MNRACIILLILGLLMTGCNAPTALPTTPTNTPDVIATEVSRLMTAAPTLTLPLASATPAPALATLELTTPAPLEPTGTPTVEASATATDQPQPTNADDTPDWTDSFEGNSLFYQFENGNTRAVQSGGSLVLTALNSNGWMGYSLTYSQKPKNFVMEATFTTQACSGSDIYGLIFRAPDDNAGYFFGVTCDGRYSLRGRNFATGADANAVELTSSTAIKSGANQTNILRVTTEGSTIGLFINDTLVHEVVDETFTEAGFIGAFIAANETPGFTVNLEEISLWNRP